MPVIVKPDFNFHQRDTGISWQQKHLHSCTRNARFARGLYKSVRAHIPLNKQQNKQHVTVDDAYLLCGDGKSVLVCLLTYGFKLLSTTVWLLLVHHLFNFGLEIRFRLNRYELSGPRLDLLLARSCHAV